LTVRFRNADHLREQYITNIGGGGVFVDTVYPLPIGAQAQMEILVGQETAPIPVRGEVIWVRNPSEGPEAGMGLRFLDPSSAVREALRELLVSEATP
jgi:uncharacterized protein (TIGR02266 family)